MQTLQYTPGQKVTIFLETLDGYGSRADCGTTPSITRIMFPDLSLANGYPQNMTRLDVGLYYYQFTLPVGAVTVGSYLVDVVYISPANDAVFNQAYQILVNAPFGNFGTTTG